MSKSYSQAQKPPLEKIKLLHQAVIENGDCMYCGKPMKDWKPMEVCESHENNIHSQEV